MGVNPVEVRVLSAASMKPIVYRDRYSGEDRYEKVYGDSFLRWTYETSAGRAALHSAVKRAWFSRWYGWRMDLAKSREKIQPFIREFELDPQEFLRDPDQFASFNEFFSRKLKPSARPIDADPNSVVFPADGRHLCVPDLSTCTGLLVKGEMFDLAALVDSPELAARYASGSLIVSRLCPVDYHRFHFPCSGTPGQSRLINGHLFSVNPIALRQNIHILATNKRCVTELETDNLGTVLVMEIGATCVGSICQTYQPDCRITKGDEKGYFRFGGSSTIMIFEPNRIRFDQDLLESSLGRHELYAKIGDRMATIIHSR